MDFDDIAFWIFVGVIDVALILLLACVVKGFLFAA